MCALQPACAKFYLSFVSNDVMINILETLSLVVKGIMNVHVARSVKCHLVKQEYWCGMAVLHWKTHQWQTFTMKTAPVD